MRVLAFLLLLACSPAWGTTWYVNSSAASGGNGTSGTPWNAFSGITGLTAGDTICISGTFDETLTLVTGTSGNLMTYDFACSGVAVGAIVRTGNNKGVTATAAVEYTVLNEPQISAGSACVDYNQTTDNTQGHHQITGGTLSYCSTHASASTNPGVLVSAHDVVIDGTTIIHVGDDAIRSSTTAGDMTIRNATISAVSERTTTGDGVQHQSPSGALLLEDSVIRYTASSNQAVVSTGAGANIIRRNEFDGEGTGDEAFGFNMTGGSTVFEKNWIHDFDVYGISANNASATTLTVRSNVFEDLSDAVNLLSSSSGTYNVLNNTADRVVRFIVSAGTQTVTATNNLIDCNVGGACISKVTASTYSGTTNMFADEFSGMFSHNAVTYSTLAAWVAGQSVDATSSIGALGVIGEYGPLAKRLLTTSAARRAGTVAGAYHDYRNCIFNTPPSIGAFEVCGGDPATTRTVATTRTARW